MTTIDSYSDLLDSEVEFRLREMGLGECGKPDGLNKVTRPQFRAIVRACPEIKVEMVDISCRTFHGVGHLMDSVNYREVPCPTCFGNGLESVWYRADQSID